VFVAGRCAKYLNDYDGFYLHKSDRNMRPFLDFGTGGASGYQIWFLPGQKGKLLRKIKTDINNELTKIMENNTDVLSGYEISNNFKNIFIYYYKNANLGNIFSGEAMESRVELYHEIKNGYGNSSWSSGSKIMNYIEVDGP